MAAGATYTPIATNTLGSTTTTVTFNSISGSYTDLILIFNGKCTTGTTNQMKLNFNSDTGTNYSGTYLTGDGTSAASGRVTNTTYARIGYFVLVDSTNGANMISHIQNYSNSTTYKTILSRLDRGSGNDSGALAAVNLWRSTSAITRIDITASNDFASGSTFTLYGIASA